MKAWRRRSTGGVLAEASTAPQGLALYVLEAPLYGVSWTYPDAAGVLMDGEYATGTGGVPGEWQPGFAAVAASVLEGQMTIAGTPDQIWARVKATEPGKGPSAWTVIGPY